MLEALINALTFLINTFVDLFVFVLMARFILVAVRAPMTNTLVRLIARLSDPLVLPFKRLLPLAKRFEWITVVWIVLLEILKFYLVGLLSSNTPIITGVLLLALAETLKTGLNLFFYAVLLQVLLSWLPMRQTEFANLLAWVTSPVMRPFRRRLHLVQGFDLSPIPVLIGLQLLIILLVDPLYLTGMRLAFG